MNKLTFLVATIFVLYLVQLSFADVQIKRDNVIVTSFNHSSYTNETWYLNYSVCAINSGEQIIRQYLFFDLNLTIDPQILYNITQNDCSLVNIILIVPRNVDSKDYKGKLIMLTLDKSFEWQINIYVTANVSWSLSPTEINVTAKRYDYLEKNVTITNSGNNELHVNITKNNVSLVFFDSSQIIVAPFSSLTRPLYFFIKDVNKTFAMMNITFVDDLGNIKTLKINMNLTDDIFPAISTVSVDKADIEIGDEITLLANITDNVRVNSVWTFSSGKRLNFTKVNDVLYQVVLNDTQTSGLKKYVIFASDDDSNVASANFSFFVSKVNAMQFVNFVDLGKAKYRTKISANFGQILKGKDIEFKLISLESEKLNNSFLVRINSRELLKNSSVIVQTVADLVLSVEQLQFVVEETFENLTYMRETSNIEDYYTYFSGKILVVAPLDVDIKDAEINFRGEFSDWSVAQPKNIDIPFYDETAHTLKNVMMPCNSYVADSYNDSYYECTVRYPVDVNDREVVIVSTAESYSNVKEGYERNITMTSRDRDAGWLWATVGWFLIIIALIILALWTFILKNMHFHR